MCRRPARHGCGRVSDHVRGCAPCAESPRISYEVFCRTRRARSAWHGDPREQLRGQAVSVKPTRGIVSSPHPTASEVGRRVLNSGGTAVDAAIAVAFTLTVVAPSCTGIAGYGGSALIYHAGDRTVHTVDFTSRAPGAGSAAMFSVRENANGRFSVAHGANAKGPLAVDIPGVLAGLALIQRRYGTLSCSEPLCSPQWKSRRSGIRWTRSRCRPSTRCWFRTPRSFPSSCVPSQLTDACPRWASG